MTTYSDIRGYRVKYLSSDPTLSTSNEGQVWYNSTTGTLKALVQIKAWSAGGNLGTSRRNLGGAGTQTAGLAMGGETVPANSNATEEYSGYAWTTGGNLTTARILAAPAGTQTAALFAGGFNPTAITNATEEYDGSTWGPGGNLNTSRYGLNGCGTQTAALAFAGNTYPGPNVGATEEYNGTAWTSNPTGLNTVRTELGSAGTQTAALGFGGATPSVTGATEEYDGSTWTSVNSMNTARLSLASGGVGIQTSALAFGGYTTTYSAVTEEYDGSTWATSPASLATARSQTGGSGSRSAALCAGGRITGDGPTDATEEYFSSIDNYDPAVASAWATGGNMNTARDLLTGCGTALSNTLVFGGDNGPSRVGATESYNGSVWTTAPSLNTNRSALGSATQGTSSAALGFAGYPSTNANEEYNGSTWTSVSSYGNSGYGVGGAGTQTAGLGVGGTGGQTSTFEYNGSTWSPGGTYPSGLYYGGVTGTQTAAIATSGSGGAGATAAKEYDGSVWTATGNYPNPSANRVSAFGIQTNAVFYDNNGSYSTNVNTYNGSVFVSAPSMATAKGGVSGRGGSGSEGLFSGDTSPRTGATEEWTAGSPASPTGAAASTLTTS